MNVQFFINEIGCNFNFRKPKSKKPTNTYFVVRVRNKQIKKTVRYPSFKKDWSQDNHPFDSDGRRNHKQICRKGNQIL